MGATPRGRGPDQEAAPTKTMGAAHLCLLTLFLTIHG